MFRLYDLVDIRGQSKCTIASMSQVTKSLKEGSFVSGIPARDHKINLRLNAQLNKLDALLKKTKK